MYVWALLIWSWSLNRSSSPGPLPLLLRIFCFPFSNANYPPFLLFLVIIFRNRKWQIIRHSIANSLVLYTLLLSYKFESPVFLLPFLFSLGRSDLIYNSKWRQYVIQTELSWSPSTVPRGNFFSQYGVSVPVVFFSCLSKEKLTVFFVFFKRCVISLIYYLWSALS